MNCSLALYTQTGVVHLLISRPHDTGHTPSPPYRRGSNTVCHMLLTLLLCVCFQQCFAGPVYQSVMQRKDERLVSHTKGRDESILSLCHKWVGRRLGTSKRQGVTFETPVLHNGYTSRHTTGIAQSVQCLGDGLDDPGFVPRQSLQSVQTNSDAQTASFQWVLKFSSPGVKRPGREVARSPQSSADVKNKWRYASTPPTCLQGVYRDN